MTSKPPAPRQVFIQGITRDGRPFRPSDWAERLASIVAIQLGLPAAETALAVAETQASEELIQTH